MNRNSKLFSVLAVAFALALSVVLAGCGQQASSSAASSSASSASASAAASASSASASASSASASASASSASASAASEASEVNYTMKIDATEANEGVLFDGTGIAKPGETVYQVLVDADLPLAVDNSSGSAYVYGIGNAIVNDSKAGWLFTVNGEMPSVGADKVEVKNGDVIEWTYYADATKAM